MHEHKTFMTLSCLIALLMLGLVAGLVNTEPTFAAPSAPQGTTQAKFVISPTLIIVHPGDVIDAELWITDINDLTGVTAWQFAIQYNSTVITATQATPNPGFWSGCAVILPTFGWNSDESEMQIAEVCLGGSHPGTGGQVATVQFQALGTGQTAIQVDLEEILRTKVTTGVGPSTEDQFPVEENLTHSQGTTANYIWTGAIDTTWDSAGNWDPSTGTPGASDAVAIPGGLSNYPTLNTSGAVDALYLLPGAEVEIPATYELTAEAVGNQGKIMLWEDIPDATATDFHIYDSGMSVSYYGATITSTGAMNATSVVIKGHQACTTQDEPGDTVDRCYDISPAQMPTSADMRLYYLDSELDGQNPATMYVWHWNSGTMTWTVAGTPMPGGSAPDYYVDVDGVTDFSPFVLKSEGSIPTHVTLQSVQAVGSWLALSGMAVSATVWALRRKRR